MTSLPTSSPSTETTDRQEQKTLPVPPYSTYPSAYSPYVVQHNYPYHPPQQHQSYSRLPIYPPPPAGGTYYHQPPTQQPAYPPPPPPIPQPSHQFYQPPPHQPYAPAYYNAGGYDQRSYNDYQQQQPPRPTRKPRFQLGQGIPEFKDEDGVVPNIIFVSGLPTAITNQELFDVFKTCGSISELPRRPGGTEKKPKIWVYKDRAKDQSRGEATVAFDDPKSAEQAVKDYDGKELFGVDAIKVEMCPIREFNDQMRTRVTLGQQALQAQHDAEIQQQQQQDYMIRPPPYTPYYSPYPTYPPTSPYDNRRPARRPNQQTPSYGPIRSLNRAHDGGDTGDSVVDKQRY